MLYQRIDMLPPLLLIVKVDSSFHCFFNFVNFLVPLLCPTVSLRDDSLNSGERERLGVDLLGSHSDRLLPRPLGLAFDTAIEDVVDGIIALQSGPGVAHAVGLLIQGGDGRNVETVPGMEDRIRGTPREPSPFLHELVCEAIQFDEIGGCDVMNREKKSNRGEEIFGVYPEFVFRSDEGFLDVIEFSREDVFDVFETF